MKYLDYSKQRYDAALNEIERLKQSEFPYPHIKDALLEIEKALKKQQQTISMVLPSSTPDIAKNACSQSLGMLFTYTPFLGFILRSTNVRNAFEVYAPILRLGRKLLGNDTKVLLSSEWDYSPFVFLPTSELKDFVLIGVPAFESANPLLIPLAGHELGHNVWLNSNLASKYDSELRNGVLDAIQNHHWAEFQAYQSAATTGNLTSDIFVQQSWLPALHFASRQLEEVFCDAMGLRLFAESYLHAFAYMLAPAIPGSRSFFYPTLKDRVAFMIRAAAKLGVTVPANYADLFGTELDPSGLVEQLLVAIADKSVATQVDNAIHEADDQANAMGIPKRDPANLTSIKESFAMVMPADGYCSLTDTLNAGWECHLDSTIWDTVANIPPEEKQRVLFDLILKTLEVSEFTIRISP